MNMEELFKEDNIKEIKRIAYKYKAMGFEDIYEDINDFHNKIIEAKDILELENFLKMPLIDTLKNSETQIDNLDNIDYMIKLYRNIKDNMIKNISTGN